MHYLQGGDIRSKIFFHVGSSPGFEAETRKRSWQTGRGGGYHKIRFVGRVLILSAIMSQAELSSSATSSPNN